MRAAARLFGERGLDATSMADIAAEAGVSRATVFNHFPSKGLMLDAISARSLREYRSLLTGLLDDETTPTAELLRQLYRDMAIELERFRDLYRELFPEIQKVSLGLDDEGEAPALSRQCMLLLVELFARGQARGDITCAQPPDVLATAVGACINGAIIYWLHSPNAVELGPMLESLLSVLMTGISTD